MKKLNLDSFGVQELNKKEMKNIEGGRSWWSHIKSAYSTLTDDLAGTLFVACAPGPAIFCIGVGGTINWATE